MISPNGNAGFIFVSATLSMSHLDIWMGHENPGPRNSPSASDSSHCLGRQPQQRRCMFDRRPPEQGNIILGHATSVRGAGKPGIASTYFRGYSRDTTELIIGFSLHLPSARI